ncbi:hypothetical protein VCHA29O37_60159 [Vibrio chagasii]|nr:hypothetical protein VCHA29O37_60159 [Vibrio chagasii]
MGAFFIGIEMLRARTNFCVAHTHFLAQTPCELLELRSSTLKNAFKGPFWGLFVLGKGAENSMSFLFLELKLFD